MIWMWEELPAIIIKTKKTKIKFVCIQEQSLMSRFAINNVVSTFKPDVERH